MLRTVIAFFLAPFLGVLLPVLAVSLISGDRVSDTFYGVLLFLIPAYASAVFIGIPLYFFFKAKGFLSVYAFMAGGYTISLTASIATSALFGSITLSLLQSICFSYIHVMGITGSVLFWLICIRGRNRQELM